MSFENWILFVIVSLIASMTPGPSILSVITFSVYNGTKKSIPIILGVLSGLFLLATLAILGLGALLESSIALFKVLQYIGSAYLLYLGVKLFFTKAGNIPNEETYNQNNNFRKLYFQGLGVSLVNPKAIGFFSAMFLPFINPDKSPIFQFIILFATLFVCSVFALFFYSIGAQLVAPSIKKFANIFNRVTGGIFIGMSILLIRSTKSS